MAEKIVVVNAYVGNDQPRTFALWLVRMSFSVALISEIAGVRSEVSKIGRVYYNRKDTPTDVGIVVANKVVARVAKAISWSGGKLTKYIRRPGTPMMWRDRWFIRVRIFSRVYYSIHANAIIAGPDGNWINNPGAEAWREAMRTLKTLIRKDIDAGRRVRVGGDFNFPANSDVELSPTDMFADLGMRHLDDGRVMYLAWTPITDILVKCGVGDTAPGADAHGVPWATLRKRPRRDRKAMQREMARVA